jgi:hypothetical protein
MSVDLWPFYKDEYYRRRDAVEATDPDLLNNPQIAAALFQIDMAEALIDKVMDQLVEAAEAEGDPE